ncbi:MAG: type II 3-dehydroquinate dehydratase [Paraglaciecola sp.]|nr:type II 3-dehydroquinate dehydratase [Paraglaciecola sp.]MDP5032600.1 type II 3-dehydroquinate dehydratase [Paraglaciecola sp.]MDP5041275.1 type II 3-dehydroquinate dehydratase [Paraglaciecola sp.]MDP5134017.1 type II 3-dehydroquinate dehydratase [Paraglaciecola sp.]
MKVLLINGPNLNMLGKREPHIYGAESLDEIVLRLKRRATELSIELEHVQSNAEHELINAIHAAFNKVDYILINPGAFTHSSIALRDALLSVNIPFSEIHLSNVHARESFRHHSYLSDVAQGVMCGFGTQGYEFGLLAAQQYLKNK